MLHASFELNPLAIISPAKCRNKAEAFAEIAAIAAKTYALDSIQVEDVLLARERLGSTGFGRATAIPHGRVGGLHRPVMIMLRPTRALAWEAVDDLPVDLIVALLSPESGGAMHLKALAELSRMLRDAQWVEKLKGARDSDSMFALIEAYERRDAA